MLLISQYNGDKILTALQAAFQDGVTPKKVSRAIKFLSDKQFQFCCSVLETVGIKIFKPFMAFLESESGMVAHNIHFKVQESLELLDKLISDVRTDFISLLDGDIENRVKSIVEYLQLIKKELQLRFGDWGKIPLIWAALGSTDSSMSKKLAALLLENTLETDWKPLQEFISQPAVMGELKRFAETSTPFKKCKLLQQFHQSHFMFSTHNVAAERAIGYIYHYTLEAPTAKPHRVSIVCRSRLNRTKIPKDQQDLCWNSALIVDAEETEATLLPELVSVVEDALVLEDSDEINPVGSQRSDSDVWGKSESGKSRSRTLREASAAGNLTKTRSGKTQEKQQ